MFQCETGLNEQGGILHAVSPGRIFWSDGPGYPVLLFVFMTGNQSFALPPGKMSISLFFATGLVIMLLSDEVAFGPLPVGRSRLYMSNGASLGPPPERVPDGLAATFGFGFGLLAEGVAGGVFATLGFGFGLLPARAADGFADGAGATFCDMRTSSIMDYGQKNQPQCSWDYEIQAPVVDAGGITRNSSGTISISTKQNAAKQLAACRTYREQVHYTPGMLSSTSSLRSRLVGTWGYTTVA
jgi:hypothetical protein